MGACVAKILNVEQALELQTQKLPKHSKPHRFLTNTDRALALLPVHSTPFSADACNPCPYTMLKWDGALGTCAKECRVQKLSVTLPCTAFSSGPAPDVSDVLLLGTLAPLRCMSVKALCSAFSVASAGWSMLSSLSVDTLAQSVLHTHTHTVGIQSTSCWS